MASRRSVKELLRERRRTLRGALSRATYHVKRARRHGFTALMSNAESFTPHASLNFTEPRLWG